MISLNEILQVHLFSIQKYGGGKGVRVEGALEAAIARPFQTFDGKDLYPTGIEKAAALVESLIVNHPFIDGNKRTGFLAMVALIESFHYVLTASQYETYDLIIKISTGKIEFEAIVDWLKKNVTISFPT